MMRAPGIAAIHAAELRVAQSGRNTHDSLRRAQVALRANLARPATLALVAGVTGLLGFWLARRPQPRAAPSSQGVAAATKASAAGLVLAFIMRYGMQRLPYLLQQVWAARQERAARGEG